MNSQHHKKHGHEEDPVVDLDFTPEEDLGDIAAAQSKFKKLKDELAAVKKERQEYLDGWQRSKADAINIKKEAAAAAERAVLKMKEGIVEELIPVLDSFDMAAGSPAWETVDSAWRSGIDHIRNQLLEVLSRNGIDRYGRIGEAYSPHLHDAVEEQSDVAGEPGEIVRVLRYGYKAGERILRPAQVVIKSHDN